MHSKLIINADDFGLCPSVNDAILELAAEGCLTSTTIIANFVKNDELELLRNTNIGTGLHINLIEGAPLSSPDEINTIVDKKGIFYPAGKLWVQTLMGKVNPLHIDKEITAQFRFLANNGITISHIDSHKHLHQFPYLGYLILNTVTKLGIRRVRYCNPLHPSSVRMSLVKGMSLMTSNSIKPFSHPDGLVSYFSAHPNGNFNVLEKEITNLFLKYSCLEIMTHPALENKTGSYLNHRAEFEFLKLNVKQRISKVKGIELINYNHL